MPGTFAALFAAKGVKKKTVNVPSASKAVSASSASTASGASATKSAVPSLSSGVAPPSSTGAQSDAFQFTKTYSAGSVDNIPLSGEADFNTLNVSISVTATGNDGSADNLAALGQWQILGPAGPIMTLFPTPDFYDISQRFGPIHIRPAVVLNTGATAVSSAYTVYGINLPMAGGPYTLLPAINSVAGFVAAGGSDTTALSVTLTVSLGVGPCPNGVSNYVYTNLPFTPAANGVNDLAPLAPIQNIDLTEVFLTGLTSNITDISYIQITTPTAPTAPRLNSGVIVGRDNGQMTSALPSTELFLLMALYTQLQLGRQTHMYLNWGATPSTTIRSGFYWYTQPSSS